MKQFMEKIWPRILRLFNLEIKIVPDYNKKKKTLYSV